MGVADSISGSTFNNKYPRKPEVSISFAFNPAFCADLPPASLCGVAPAIQAPALLPASGKHPKLLLLKDAARLAKVRIVDAIG